MSPSEYILAPNQTHKRTASWSEITNVKQNEKCTQTYADRRNHLVPDPNKTQVSNMVSLSSHPSPSQLDFLDEKTSAKREQSPMNSSLSFSAETENMRMERLLGSLCHNLKWWLYIYAWRLGNNSGKWYHCMIWHSKYL